MSSIFSTPKDLATALNEFSGVVATRIEDFQKERKKADLYEATGFTVFDYLDSDENRMSDVICDLLDQSGKHGQGTLFLNSFLDTIGVPSEIRKLPCRVKREDCTLYCSSFQRRIDITLELGDFCVGIENKPYAFEGEAQLKDYNLHLRRKHGQRYMLVYLSGDGSDPTSISKTDLAALRASKKFKRLTYRTDLHDWLERCAQECKADKVRWFLRDFAEYVKSNKAFELSEANEEPIHEDD